jgi:hypothetical protein
MAGTTSRMGRFYTEKRAAAELRTYKEKGPRPAARILIEALRAEGVEAPRCSTLAEESARSSTSCLPPALPRR